MLSIASIICIYYPNSSKVLKLTNNLSQFGKVYIFINGGDLNEFELKNNQKIKIIKSKQNIGTAGAYNQIFESTDHPYYWLWDQDSFINKEDAFEFLGISEKIFRKNKKCFMTTISDPKNSFKFTNKNFVLPKASSSLINTKRTRNYMNLRFDQSLFLDYADWEFAYRIMNSGGLIKQVDNIKLLHELGSSYKTIFGNYLNAPKPFRITFQIVNTFYLFHKYKYSLLTFILLIRLILLPFKILIFKDNLIRLKYYLYGIKLGFQGLNSYELMKKKIMNNKI